MARYMGLIDGLPGAYGIHFPDLPGCTSMGATVEETIANGADALRQWVEVAGSTGMPVPLPRDFESLRHDPVVAEILREGATVAAVPLIRSVGETVDISIDRGALAVIDAEAERRAMTRSALVETMVREMLPRAS